MRRFLAFKALKRGMRRSVGIFSQLYVSIFLIAFILLEVKRVSGEEEGGERRGRGLRVKRAGGGRKGGGAAIQYLFFWGQGSLLRITLIYSKISKGKEERRNKSECRPRINLIGQKFRFCSSRWHVFGERTFTERTDGGNSPAEQLMADAGY